MAGVVSPELMGKIDEVLEFGKQTPAANRKAVADALKPLQNHRAEYPFVRVTPNQALVDSNNNGRPDGWIIGSHIQCDVVDSIVTAKPWDERSALEREIITACGGAEGLHYWQANNANVWRLSWSNVPQADIDEAKGSTFLFYLPYQGLTALSQRAVTKIEAGSITDASFTRGAEVGTAKLTGFHGKPANRYTSTTSRVTSTSGSVLIALPAILNGVHPDDRWGYFGATANGVE